MTADPLLALQQHFESEYGKLELPKQSKKRKRNATAIDPAPKPTPTTEQDQDREWKGIENPVLENVREPEVVTFHDSASMNEDVVGGSYRAFMSSKTPKAASLQKKVESTAKDGLSTEDDETQNLKMDIALQRLLRESDLFSSSTSKKKPEKLHHLTLDSRIEHLGGRKETAPKIPVKIRKGIEDAKRKKEEKVEREAKEAGIVMPIKKLKGKRKERERGLRTGASVGKFRGGMLKVSERDIQRINQSGRNNNRGILGRGKGVKKLFK